MRFGAAFIACAMALMHSSRADLVVQVQATNGQIMLNWQGQSGYAYRVLESDSLSQAWEIQLTNIAVPGAARRVDVIDQNQAPGGGAASRFYRVAQLKISAPISIINQSNVVVSGLFITNNAGPGINIQYSTNITVVGCFIGPCSAEGVHVEDSQSVRILSNRFEVVSSGVYALNSSQVQVCWNACRNVQGPSPRGQLAQFDKVNGGSNCINSNQCQNILGQSYPEDAINLFQSNGLTNDPIRVIGNKIRGGGPSSSGGGIIAGDGGGSNILVQGNTLVDPGQYGLAVASGENIQIVTNRVYAKQQPFTNVGIYVWNQYAPACGNITVSGNNVLWFNSSGAQNPGWNANNCGTVQGWDSNNWSANLDESLLPDPLL